MSFSQGWDTGFKSLLIFIGTVFVWLMYVEDRIASKGLSVTIMTAVAVILAVGFFLNRCKHFIAERSAADAEVAALLAEEG